MFKIIKTNKIYIDCFFYGFYIEKNELIKYKNKNNEVYINSLINKQSSNNFLTKIKSFNSLSNYFYNLTC